MLLNEFLKEHRKVESLEKAMAEQQKENATIRAMLKAQADQVQKVSAQLELSKSAPHTVRSDELWLWHRGGPLALSIGGEEIILGPDVEHGQLLQAVVPGGVSQWARPATGPRAIPGSSHSGRSRCLAPADRRVRPR